MRTDSEFHLLLQEISLRKSLNYDRNIVQVGLLSTSAGNRTFVQCAMPIWPLNCPALEVGHLTCGFPPAQFYGARLRAGQIPMMVLEFLEVRNLREATPQKACEEPWRPEVSLLAWFILLSWKGVAGPSTWLLTCIAHAAVALPTAS